MACQIFNCLYKKINKILMFIRISKCNIYRNLDNTNKEIFILHLLFKLLYTIGIDN